jgi:hypothetical protein
MELNAKSEPRNSKPLILKEKSTMPHDEKLNILWNLTDIVHKEIIKVKDELEEFRKYSDRIITQHEEDLASLYKQSFDIYSEILELAQRQTPSAYESKRDFTTAHHTFWEDIKTRTNTFDKKIQDRKYSSYRPDTSSWEDDDEIHTYWYKQ